MLPTPKCPICRAEFVLPPIKPSRGYTRRLKDRLDELTLENEALSDTIEHMDQLLESASTIIGYLESRNQRASILSSITLATPSE